ncbi:MAG: hypothetical protein FJW38_16355 [Acidobacteria bacterium]|nr:hypothetical protein [Acidobacteriota bacterium]
MPFSIDKHFKILSDDDPRMTLALFAGIPMTADLEVEPLDRELNVETLRADNLYRCRRRGEEFIVHLEVVSFYKPAVLEKQFDYVQAIVAKYKLPCRSHLVLLTSKGVPDHLPRKIYRKRGDYEASLRLRVTRLWTMPAGPILRWNQPKLLPLIPLTDATDEQLGTAVSRLRSTANKELSAQLFLLGGLRYGSRRAFLERIKDLMTTTEILQDSVTYQEIVAEAKREGKLEGKLEGLQDLMSQMLTLRFGPLPQWATTRIQSADHLAFDRWTAQFLSASTLEEILK